MAENEQSRPLALAQVKPSPSPARTTTTTSDEEACNGKSPKSSCLRNRRCLIWGCGCCGATVVILALVILILALTVFKVKDPDITMNSVTIDGFKIDSGTFSRPASANTTLTADISVKNPNAVSLRFGNSTTQFFYMGERLGFAYVPQGKAPADGTLRMNVTVELLINRGTSSTNMTAALLSGSLDLTTYTGLSGRVNIWGIIKKHVDLKLNCSMTFIFTISRQEILNRVCKTKVEM